ncbi:MAG: FCD domain-containing protein [Geminicoccaceae bacterium]
MRNHDGIVLAVADHGRILEALTSRDSKAAADAMRGHLDTVASLLAGIDKVSET